MRKKILAFVMAGGRGSRLEPLTAAKPAQAPMVAIASPPGR